MSSGKNNKNSSSVMVLDDIRPHYFYCEHCNRATSIYILSGDEQNYKCGSCGRRSRMNHKPEYGHLGSIGATGGQFGSIGSIGTTGSNFGLGGIVFPERPDSAPSINMASVSKTFTVRLSNSSSKICQVELFGANKMIKVKNYGIPDGVSVSVVECSYLDLLKESIELPFMTDGFRISSDNRKQLKSFVKWKVDRDDGNITEMPLRISNYYSVFQFEDNWINVSPYSVLVSGITSFVIDIHGNTDVDIMFMVGRQASPSVRLPFIGAQQLTLAPETIDRIING